VDIRQRQIGSGGQELVIEALAEAVSRPGVRLLEVGSWCGDSALILGRVAERAGGTLVCVDWWKGNVGTDLAQIASSVDVFSVFWKRICDHGLADVVVPLRDRSDRAAVTLESEAFDLVFLDADHRYDQVSADIRAYQRLVRRGGILCGHDCEGRPSDYDPAFLRAGTDVDCHESVHCGVVLAVAEAFPACTITQSIWSVRRGQQGWRPTRLRNSHGTDLARAPVPPIGCTRHFTIFRYDRWLYAVPHTLAQADIREEAIRTHREVRRARQVAEFEQALGESVVPMPALVESHMGFNLVSFRGRLTALARSIGPVDLATAADEDLDRLRRQGLCVDGASLGDVKLAIDALQSPPPVAPAQANVAELETAVAESRSAITVLERQVADARQALADSAGRLAALQQRAADLEREATEERARGSERDRQLAHAERVAEESRAALAASTQRIADLDQALGRSAAALQALGRELAEQRTRADSVTMELTDKVHVIGSLVESMAIVEARAAMLDRELVDHRAALNVLQERLAERDETIEALAASARRRDRAIQDLENLVRETAMELELRALGVAECQGRPAGVLLFDHPVLE
jgi:uncharacterized coiled-coil protein SlyX